MRSTDLPISMSVMVGSEAHPCAPTVRQGMCMDTTTHRPAALASSIQSFSCSRSGVPRAYVRVPEGRAMFGAMPMRRMLPRSAYQWPSA